MRNKITRKVVCGILFAVILVTALFIYKKLFDRKLTCTGIITDYIGDWEYDSDCFIVEESKTGAPWIVYESLEEINNRLYKNLDYGDRVWVSYTTNSYEISPGLMEVVYIIELRNDTTAAFKTDNISKIWFKFGPWEEVEVPSEDIEEITDWLETFKIGNRVKRRETQPAGTNSVSVKIEYSDGTIVENGLSTMKIGKKEYHLVYEKAPYCYIKMYDSVGNEVARLTKKYVDKNTLPGPTSIWMKDTEIIWTGVVIDSMGVNCKNETYESYANKYDIHFLFDDKIPAVNFYTVPMVAVFATDSDGGYIASMDELPFLGSKAPICYISRNKECFLIADNFNNFINSPKDWKEHIKPYDEIEIFSSMEEAKNKYEFLDVSEFDMG